MSLTGPALQVTRGPWELASAILYRMTTDRARAPDRRACRPSPSPETTRRRTSAGDLAARRPTRLLGRGRSGAVSASGPPRPLGRSRGRLACRLAPRARGDGAQPRHLARSSGPSRAHGRCPLRHGAGPAALGAATAARWPDQPAIVDERGELTYRELDRRAVASPPHYVTSVASRPRQAGADVPQSPWLPRGPARRLTARRRPAASQHRLRRPPTRPGAGTREAGRAILDEEFAPAFDQAGFDGNRVIAWDDDGESEATIDAMIVARQAESTRGSIEPKPGATRPPHLGNDRALQRALHARCRFARCSGRWRRSSPGSRSVPASRC